MPIREQNERAMACAVAAELAIGLQELLDLVWGLLGLLVQIAPMVPFSKLED
jgi:hypothetical protein